MPAMSEPDVLCEFQVPLRYGKRRPDKGQGPVEPEVILSIENSLKRQFGGLTPMGKIERGSWWDEEEQLFDEEDSLLYRVWVREGQLPTLEQVIGAIGAELGQKQM